MVTNRFAALVGRIPEILHHPSTRNTMPCFAHELLARGFLSCLASPVFRKGTRCLAHQPSADHGVINALGPMPGQTTPAASARHDHVSAIVPALQWLERYRRAFAAQRSGSDRARGRRAWSQSRRAMKSPLLALPTPMLAVELELVRIRAFTPVRGAAPNPPTRREIGRTGGPGRIRHSARHRRNRCSCSGDLMIS